jgi:hypothetical protein
MVSKNIIMKRSDITTAQVLRACHAFHQGGEDRTPLQILIEEYGAPEKVAYSAMEREENKGFVECGVSLRTSWVTPKGYEFLETCG